MADVTPRPLRTAEVIAVGSELLGATRVDTNSLFLAERLGSIGIELRAKAVVGDNRGDLAALFRQASERADVVILTGGLGPTDDDLTRDVVADVLGRPLEEDAEIVARLRQRFASRGLRMPEVNRRQAQVPRGATVLANPNGTAPGLLIEQNGRLIVLLPGPPREVQPMFESLITAWLEPRTGRERLHYLRVFVTGRTESHVEEAIQPIYSPWRTADPPVETTILAAPGQIELHFTTRSSDGAAARAMLDKVRDAIVAALGEDVFSVDGRPMEVVVGEMLQAAGLTIAAAESCTGGLTLSRLTDVPGSSAYVRGGIVAYSNDVKASALDVPPHLIASHGAVSEPVAAAMAAGVRGRLGADVGIGITGIAGPDGGSAQKPVGTVALALDGPGGYARARTVWLPGGRSQVKMLASQAALDMVRRALMQDAAVRRR
jgi:competence/damage-inducible protein CinA-like protein